jgi:amidase
MRLSPIWSAACLAGLAFAAQDQSFGIDLTPSLFPSQQNADTSHFFPMQKCGSFQLEEATIDQMQAALQDGTLTSVQLVMCYMMRNYQTDDYTK